MDMTFTKSNQRLAVWLSRVAASVLVSAGTRRSHGRRSPGQDPRTTLRQRWTTSGAKPLSMFYLARCRHSLCSSKTILVGCDQDVDGRDQMFPFITHPPLSLNRCPSFVLHYRRRITAALILFVVITTVDDSCASMAAKSRSNFNRRCNTVSSMQSPWCLLWGSLP